MSSQEVKTAKEIVPTESEKFVRAVERQFMAQLGQSISWNDVQKTLAQNLYIKIDNSLKALEAKRLTSNKGGSPITWQNVNLAKLALDAVHRVALGLDGSIANHVHVVPYFNSKLQKYDLDLRIGYVGKVLIVKTMSLDPLIDVVYDLIYDTDEFTANPRTVTNPIESYDLKIRNPFDRGKVIGGFFYFSYEDARKNRLVLVNQRDFTRAETAAQTKDFWGNKDGEKSRIEMQMKTVVHRGADKAILDPNKINAPSLKFVQEQEMLTAEYIIDAEATDLGNKEPMAITADEKLQAVPTMEKEPEKVPAVTETEQEAPY